MPYKPRTNYRGPAIDRITANRTVTETGCWETPFTPSLNYPTICHQGVYVFVHRYVYQHYKGPIPDNLSILHHCDNPRCHNPKHLYAGTHTQNMADCVNRGRHPKKYSFKTLSQLFGLREAGMNGAEIARILKLSHSGVANILQQHGMAYPKGGRQAARSNVG